MIVAAARVSFSTEQPHITAAALTSWKEAASAIAAGPSSRPVERLKPETTLERLWLITKEQPAQRPIKKSEFTIMCAL